MSVPAEIDRELKAMIDEPTAHSVQRRMIDHFAKLQRVQMSMQPILAEMFKRLLGDIPPSKGGDDV